MIFYLTTYIDLKDPDGPGVERFEWDTTQADAATTRKRLLDAGVSSTKTDQVDIPVDKPSLHAWLRSNLLGKDLAGLLIPPRV